MRNKHRIKKVKYSVVREKVENSGQLNLPPGDTLRAPLPMIKLELAVKCDRGHLTLTLDLF
jgi:hypothetical protein